LQLKNIDYLTFGAHKLDHLAALSLDGDFDSVIKLLQGQVTSDCSKLSNGLGQPSALCDEKGYILCNFDLLLNMKSVAVIIHREQQDIFIDEMSKFAPFFKVSLSPLNAQLTGWIRKPKEKILLNEHIIFSTEHASASLMLDLEISEEGEAREDEWSINRKLLGDHLIEKKDHGKYRPHELMQDLSRVSFTKGCFRGQEIIARMEYLGKQKKQTELIVHNSLQEVVQFEVIGSTIQRNKKYFSSCLGKKNLFTL